MGYLLGLLGEADVAGHALADALLLSVVGAGGLVHEVAAGLGVIL